MRGRSVSGAAVAFAIASFAFVLGNWEALPDPYPIHWNWRGVADGFMPKPWGPLLLPAIVAFVVALMSIVARVAEERSTRKGLVLFAAIIGAAMFAFTMVTTM